MIYEPFKNFKHLLGQFEKRDKITFSLQLNDLSIYFQRKRLIHFSKVNGKVKMANG